MNASVKIAPYTECLLDENITNNINEIQSAYIGLIILTS